MRVVFIGTGKIGVPALQTLLKSEHDVAGVVTQPDKPVGRAQSVEPPPIKRSIATAGIPVLQPARIKERQAIEAIRNLTPDVIVVMAYGQILPRDVLKIPKIACLNLHASLLPRWRGASPIQAAIFAGDRETGITVMYMNEGLDTGDILLQRAVAILPAETGGSLHDRLATVAPDALLAALALIAHGKASRAPQDNSVATYAPKLKREDGRIDWSKPAEEIERKIRAFDPWPGAFTTINGNDPRKLKIFSVELVDFEGAPGEILRKQNELIVVTSKRALSLREVQLEGKRRMGVEEFLRGHPLIASL